MPFDAGAIVGRIELDASGAYKSLGQFTGATQSATGVNVAMNASLLKMGGAFGVATIAVQGLQTAMGLAEKAAQGLLAVFERGIKSLDEYATQQASLAAELKSFYPAAPFEEAYKAAGALLPAIEKMDRAFSGSGDQLRQMALQFVRLGAGGEVMKLITDESGKQQKAFVAVAEAIKSVTAGQNFEVQLMQETRALLTGEMAARSALAQKLRAQGVDLKKISGEWKTQQTILQNLQPYLQAYVDASAKVSNTLDAQLATLQTMVNRFLRAGLYLAYQDILKVVRWINDALFDQQGNVNKLGTALVGIVQTGWQNLRSLVVALWNAFKTLAPNITTVADAVNVLSLGLVSVEVITERIVRHFALLVQVAQKIAGFFTGMAKALTSLPEAVLKRIGVPSGMLDFLKRVGAEFGARMGKPGEILLKGFGFEGIPEEIRKRTAAIAAETAKSAKQLSTTFKAMQFDLGPSLVAPTDPEAARKAAEAARKAREKQAAEAHKLFRQIAEEQQWSITEQVAGIERLQKRYADLHDFVRDLEHDKLMLIQKDAELSAKYQEEQQKKLARMYEAGADLEARLLEHGIEHQRVMEEARVKNEQERVAAAERRAGEIYEIETDLQRKLADATMTSAEQARSEWEKYYNDRFAQILLLARTEEEYTRLMADLDAANRAMRQQFNLEDFQEQLRLLSLIDQETEALQKQASVISQVLAGAWDSLTNSISDFFDQAMQGAVSFQNLFLGVLASIRRAIAELLAQWIQSQLGQLLGMALAPAGLPAAPAGAFPVMPMPPFVGFQTGGIVTRPTMALLGESGPEAVVPLTGPNAVAPVNITIQAIDTQTGMDFLLRNRESIAQAVALQFRDNAPIGRR